ncbi:bZIP transcription factor 46-like isoform X1 [Typha angustifolia]|uniref:bZIP transcription factor 46-like isoform X1 n=1 Tax=Typha angustifolia TaxID=59011 RepID=UPI003C2DA96A
MNSKSMGSDGKEGRPPALARQGSIYSLTFDELQNTLGGPGKDFGSMNMDELLKSIWTAEESQVMASALGSDADAGGLQRQGSLTLPRTLSQKTVDEVWRDLVREGGQAPAAPAAEIQHQRQPALGEMTLEEFLVRAGVVREDMNQSVAPRPINNNNGSNSLFYGNFTTSNDTSGLAIGFSQTGRSGGNVLVNPISNSSALNSPIMATGQRNYAASLPLGSNRGGIVGIGDPAMNAGLMPGVVGLGGGGVATAAIGSPANQISSDGLGKGNGDLSSLSPVPYVFNGGLRGRKSGGAVEKVVERRQRRMIKNRESAARSRARKQAYTMELEAEVAKLKEQNEELQKKQAEIMEMQKNQVLEMINQQRGPKKLCLRRTQTGPW